MTCSCGDGGTHEVARRVTTDGIYVVLWDDGAVTGRLGLKLPGVPIARPRTAEALAVSRAAGWMFADEVALYDADEVPTLYAACRYAAERGLDAGAARAKFADGGKPTVRPIWTVLQADRDGRPTERVWRLPRIRWPGLAVFDFCGKALRYQVFTCDRTDVCMPTGFRFATLGELAAHLHSIVHPSE